MMGGVAPGAGLGGETIGRRTLLGMALILVSVVAITTTKAKQASMAADAASSRAAAD